MGRLFWKFFFAFWLALLTAGLGVGVAVWLYNRPDAGAEAVIERGPPAALLVKSAALTLEHGGPEALRAMLQQWRDDPMRQLFVVDGSGRDLLGRPVPAEALSEARAQVLSPPRRRHPVALELAMPQGQRYLFFATQRADIPAGLRPPRARPPRLLPITAGVIASLLFSALLAWYFAKPIRNLRSAMGAAAQGDLDVRIASRMGSRRDELADLGREYDHMADRLRAAMEAQQRLLHDVSHELRSPLARLQAAIGLARQDPARMEATLERVERESIRLDGLVGELLTLSRLEARTARPGRETVDLVELAEALAEDAGFEAAAAGRALDFKGEGQALAEVEGELMSRAFENVIRNGVKYTGEGTVVEVSAGPSADGGSFLLVVMDRGPGVPEAELKRIFEPFYRGPNGRAAAGYGLGLAIAIRAVEAHGGTLTARNREGGGLVVEVSIPLGVKQTRER